MIEITSQPIDTAAVLASVQSDQAGAAVLFVGSTRQFTDGRETLKLDYQCYEAMAIKKMTEILEQASNCLLYTSPSPRDRTRSRMPSSA